MPRLLTRSSLTVSIIVPATNQPPTLGRCLGALRSVLGDQDEIIVVDSEETADHVPIGSPAELRNIGAQRAKGDVLLFVDADVVIHPDALSLFRAAFERNPDLVAAFGCYDDDPPPGVVSSFRNLLHHNVHWESAGEAQTWWAGLGAVRRDRFLETGGFDVKRYPRPMLEDVELGLRLTDAGHRILLMPEAQGLHLKRWSLRTMVSSDFRDRGIPWTRLLIERRQVPATLNLGWHHRLTALCVVSGLALGVQGRWLRLAVPAVGMTVMNRRFYGTLRRRGGLPLAVAGLALHAVHHLTAVVAVPFGIAAHLRGGHGPPIPFPLVTEYPGTTADE